MGKQARPGTAPLTTNAHYTGTAPTNSEPEITVHPEYTDINNEECKAVGLGTAKVDTHYCDYVLTGETDGTQDATVELECTSGHFIEVTVPNICTLKFGPQSGLSGVHYDEIEENGKKAVTVTVTVTGVHFTKDSAGGFFCGLVPCHEVSANTCDSGVLNENVKVTGYEDEGSSVSAEHTWTVNEGPQVNIEVTQ